MDKTQAQTTPRLCLLAATALRGYLDGDALDDYSEQDDLDNLRALADRLESATSLDEAHDDLCEAWEIADGL